MKTITTKTTLIAALLVSTTLVVSGCTQTSTPTPVAKTQTQLKHSFGAQQINVAITNAAKENGWSVLESSSPNSLVLKKTFTKKETDKNARGRTWNKVAVTEEIVANVNISDKSYEINLSEESQAFFKNYMAQTELKKDMHTLENAISVELVHEIL